MKHLIRTSTVALLQHKRLLWLLVVMLLFAIGVIVYIAITIEPSELRVITHYTAYGITHFYLDQWTYLFSFIGLVALMALLGVGITIKLLRQDRESLALMYGWASIALIAMTIATYVHLTRFI